MSSYTSRLRALPAEYRTALSSFAKSSSSFQIIRTTNTHQAPDHSLASTAPDRVYVLDSSFNPPTRGHLDIALSALKSDASPSKHLLLLLATQNADKAPKPAAFEQRLVLMKILADDLLESFSDGSATSKSDNPGPNAQPEVTIHIGVTKHPYFINKSQAIAGDVNSCSETPSLTSKSLDTSFPFPPTRQTHLIGFDTLIRILDPKYYDEGEGLKSLAPLFQNHQLRVTLRTDDGFGSQTDQQSYVEGVRDGKLDDKGAERAWADQIMLVEGVNSMAGATSSTRARHAAKDADETALIKMCSEKVTEYVLQGKLYQDQ